MKIPKHVAIIMDGNGRWAQDRGRPRVFGHIRGVTRIRPLVKEANQLGIQALTLFAFSTENWSRPKSEKDVLWKLLIKYLKREIDELDRENVRLNVVGEVERLPSDVLEILKPSIDRLSSKTGLKLTFAVSYGSRRELTEAAKAFARDCTLGERKIDDLNEDLFGRYLWTSALGDLSNVDLVIRSSGEQRVSNFLLWQAAYAEYVFVQEYWPDFGRKQFHMAIEEFSRRKRRFGGIDASAPSR